MFCAVAIYCGNIWISLSCLPSFMFISGLLMVPRSLVKLFLETVWCSLVLPRKTAEVVGRDFRGLVILGEKPGCLALPYGLA